MLDPAPLPVIVGARANHFKLLVNAVSKKLLKAFMLSKRNMRAFVEYVTTIVPKRSRMASMVAVLIVDYRWDSLLMEPIRSSKTCHARTQNRYFLHTTFHPCLIF